MERFAFFKSILDMDRAPVVVCDLEHTIIYMNPVAIKRYHGDLTGKSLMACHNPKSCEMIEKVIKWFEDSPENNTLRDDSGKLIGYYEKHEYRDRETMPLYDGIK